MDASGPELLVGFAVSANTLAPWQRDAIDAMRTVAGIDVHVVFVEGSLPPTYVEGRVSLDGFDVVIDFARTSHPYATRIGTWSFQFGCDNDAAFPFAREFASGDRTIDVQLVERSGDAVSVLRTARLPASPWYPSTVRKALAEAARWPAELVAALRDGATLPRTPLVAHGRSAGAGRVSIASFAVAALKRLVGSLARELVTDHVWNVGLASGGSSALLRDEPLQIKWLDASTSHAWIADPFVVERNGIRAVFVEQYDERRRKGHIAALVVHGDMRTIASHRAIELKTHLSYPFPLEVDGQLYLLPESAETGRVRRYRCSRFPDVWEPDETVIADIDALDTTFVQHGDLWWAFFTRASRGHDVALHAMYGPTALGPWTAHPLNPIVLDVSCARPAGPFFEVDGVLYRPAQDCSKTYGGAIAIARIDELSPRAFRETIVRRIAPSASPYLDGIHTVSFLTDTIAVDGKRTVRSFTNVPRNAIGIARRVTSALLR